MSSTATGPAINIRAILLGFGAITIGSVIGGVVLGLLSSTVTPIDPSIVADSPKPGGYAASLILGLGLTVFGARMAARRAGDRELLHAAIVGFLALLLGLVALLTTPTAGPIWFVAASALLTLPCALFGGQLARRSR